MKRECKNEETREREQRNETNLNKKIMETSRHYCSQQKEYEWVAREKRYWEADPIEKGSFRGE